VPKCLKMPVHPKGPKEASSEAPSAPSPTIPLVPSNAVDESADQLKVARWLQLADKVLANPNGRKRA
jgi:hypothetical protein